MISLHNFDMNWHDFLSYWTKQQLNFSSTSVSLGPVHLIEVIQSAFIASMTYLEFHFIA